MSKSELERLLADLLPDSTGRYWPLADVYQTNKQSAAIGKSRRSKIASSACGLLAMTEAGCTMMEGGLLRKRRLRLLVFLLQHRQQLVGGEVARDQRAIVENDGRGAA